MNEEQTNPVTESETPVSEPTTGNIPKADTKIAAVNAAAERMEKANAEAKVIEERRELNNAEDRIAGSSEAGQEPIKLSDEDRKKKEAKEFFKGTQLETAIDAL